MTAPRRQTLAPVAAAALLIAMLVLRVFEHAPPLGVGDYMADAAVAIDDIPRLIGAYVGNDSEVTPGAIELLQPNRILQRRYTDPETGRGFSLVLVHCGSAKDMIGHYPPNCYPRAGWVPAAPNQTVSVESQEIVIPATLYHFEKKQGFSSARSDILSFFVVPTGPQRFGPDIRLVDRASRSTRASQLGAAQVQVITSDDIDEQQREAIWRAVLDAVYPALHTIAESVP